MPGAMHHGVRVALEEAVMNVAMHGFAPGTSGEITVRSHKSSDVVTFVVEDTGRAFDPSAAPVPARPASLLDAEPGGLGLTLLRHYCPDLTYERIGDQNRLTLRFALPKP
jgi:anti-sigma regulatory factor (Ser/Thr protein kinase)